MEQLDLLDEARRRRDGGQRMATHATDVAWTHAADQAVRDLAASGRVFTAEDLRRIVGAPIGSPNAMGGALARAARAGVIRPAGFRQAERPEAHGRILRAWTGAT